MISSKTHYLIEFLFLLQPVVTMKNIVKKWWFSLFEMMVVIGIIWLIWTLTFNYAIKSDDKEAVNTFKLLLSSSLESISQEAKNGVTTPDLVKFKNSSDSDLRRIYEENADKHWKSDSFSRFSPLNQTAYYYWLYFNVWNTFMRQVQYEQEWCFERRQALKNKLVSWNDFWTLDTSSAELNLDLTSLIWDEDNYSTNDWSSKTTSAKSLEIKEAELLDSWSCYINSEKKFFWTNRFVWLTWIDFGNWMVKDKNTWLVVLVDWSNPYTYRLFNKDTKVNSIRNQFDYDITWLDQKQRKFLLKNYWTDSIWWTGELKRVRLQFSLNPQNRNNCEDKDFVDFSTRANAWATYNANFEKWLICLTLDKEALSEMARSR